MKRTLLKLILAVFLVTTGSGLTVTAIAEEKGGFLGVVLQALNEDLKEAHGFQGDGVLILDVLDGSPAAEANLKVGAIITSIDSEQVDSVPQLVQALRDKIPGDPMDLDLFFDGANFSAAVVLGEHHSQHGSAHQGRKWMTLMDNDHPMIGITMQDIDNQLADYFQVKQGILVTQVLENSPADDAGIGAGDVLVRFNGSDVGTARELRYALKNLSEGDEVNIDLVRDGNEQSVTVTLASNARLLEYIEIGPGESGHQFEGLKWIPQLHELSATAVISPTDIEDLKSEVEELRNDLAEIRKELEGLKN